MEVNKLLIVPDRKNLAESIELARKYNCGFEYNDFFIPDILDNKEKLEEIMGLYQGQAGLTEYCTFHGAFFDVTVFSDDSKIFAASDYRVEQSIDIARRLGVKAIVFHTNYVVNFKQKAYRDSWVDKNATYWTEKLLKYPDINIYIENMFDNDWELIMALGERMKAYNGFGICLDYAHACVFGDEGKINDWCKKLGPYVKHVHINDNDFTCDAHQALGTGRIDWEGFKNNYNMYFPKASVLIEMNGLEKIKASLEYIKAL